MRRIELNAKLLIVSSIVATVFIAINIAFRAFGQHDLVPMAQSLYFQLVALISMRSFRVDDVNFEVYRGGSIVA